mmetsp:Transcript_96862/g.172386  ORF Transcript_96862/g.172386 Transcript_96862/m.172386 type:complete len:290 (+) Transcript_96862:276-1145(+)
MPKPRCERFQSLIRPGFTFITSKVVPLGACSTCNPNGPYARVMLIDRTLGRFTLSVRAESSFRRSRRACELSRTPLTSKMLSPGCNCSSSSTDSLYARTGPAFTELTTREIPSNASKLRPKEAPAALSIVTVNSLPSVPPDQAVVAMDREVIKPDDPLSSSCVRGVAKVEPNATPVFESVLRSPLPLLPSATFGKSSNGAKASSAAFTSGSWYSTPASGSFVGGALLSFSTLLSSRSTLMSSAWSRASNVLWEAVWRAMSAPQQQSSPSSMVKLQKARQELLHINRRTD